MPPKSSNQTTPKTVVRFGWRDVPYRGKDWCEECGGWGTVPWVDNMPYRKNCPTCLGTGHNP